MLTPDPVGPQGSGQDGPTHYNLKTTPAQRLFGGQEAKTKPFSSPTEAKADSHKIVSYATIASSTQRHLQKVLIGQAVAIGHQLDLCFCLIFVEKTCLQG